MGRLIDADDLIKWLKLTCSSPCNCDSCGERGSKTCVRCVAEWAVNKAPTVAPVKHGKWLLLDKYYEIYECSVCHVWGEGDERYCSNCGAKMDGDSNG